MFQQQHRGARKMTIQAGKKSSPLAKKTVDDDASLARAINAMSLRTASILSPRQLPFLRRNLRRVLDESETQVAVVKLHKLFVLNGKEHSGFYSFGWRCPLCRVKMQFGTRNGLRHHLDIMHSRCQCQWSVKNEASRPFSYSRYCLSRTQSEFVLKIVLPENTQESVDDEDEEEYYR